MVTQLNNDEIVKSHKVVLKKIKKNLSGVEKSLLKQILVFKKSKSSIKNRVARKDSGYNLWSKEVIRRFNNHCCVCLSSKNVVAHHLYSYKYYLHLRTNIDNGVCLCNKCHVKFHDVYDSVTTASQFFEFMEIMRSEKLREYLLKGIGAGELKFEHKWTSEEGIKSELIKYKSITFLSYTNGGVYYEVKNKFRSL